MSPKIMASPEESVVRAFASLVALPPSNVETVSEALPLKVGLNSAMNASSPPLKFWAVQRTGKVADVVSPATITWDGATDELTAIPCPESVAVPPR